MQNKIENFIFASNSISFLITFNKKIFICNYFQFYNNLIIRYMNIKCILGFHSWDDCICTACGIIRDEQHDWSTNCEKCSKCGKIFQIEIGSICKTCGKKILSWKGEPYCYTCNRNFNHLFHDWSKDCEKCSKCITRRDNQHYWSKDCNR